MKWLGRILYVILVIMVGNFIITIANFNKQVAYYTAEAIPYLRENKKVEYMEEFMTTNVVEKYLKEPIYTALSSDDEMPLDLSIYHLVANKDYTYLMFYFDDREFGKSDGGINYPIRNKEQYEDSKELVSLKINIFLGDEDFVTSAFYPMNLEDRMPAALLIVNEKTNDNGDKERVFSFNWVNEKNKTELKAASYISKIEVVLTDKTYVDGASESEKEPLETQILEIKHNSDFEFDSNQNLVKENNVMKTNDFNGNIENFDVEAIYEDESLVTFVDLEKLKPYQKVVTKAIIIYSLVVAILTFLIFFLKPSINYIKNRKSIVTNGNTNDGQGTEILEDKAIFKDDLE